MSAFGKKEESVLAPTLMCHTWNGDRSMCAVCPNSKDIIIYKTHGSEDLDKWEEAYQLTEHDHLVTALDWAPKTNRILSCSQDRNAYVWNFEARENEWKPTLVLLRINRAATCCKWSPDENKFAVGSGAKLVSICYYEDENKWWVAKMIKKPIKSTVLSVAWHPHDNSIIAVASSDFKCRIFSAWIKNVDPKAAKKVDFGELIHPNAEFTAKGWIHDVAFSPSGNRLAFVSHDSSITIVDTAQEYSAETVHGTDLPFRSLIFTSENSIIAAGHDFTPVAFSCGDGKWQLNGKVDTGDGQEKKSAVGVRAAFSKFQTESAVGAKNALLSNEPKTKHKNMIREVKVYSESGGKATRFSTCAQDGRILLWDVSDVVSKCSGFAL